jgi:hypothetical protein
VGTSPAHIDTDAGEFRAYDVAWIDRRRYNHLQTSRCLGHIVAWTIYAGTMQINHTCSASEI